MRRCACKMAASWLLIYRHGARRPFGNAPNRVRPVETPCDFSSWQSSREVSGFLVIVAVFAVPVWFIVLSGTQEERKREVVLEWAREQAERHGHESNNSGAEEKV
ncbi:hypothetical protein DPX39_080022200 [Trypanosoma brucei equiperdum]|uniref:Uncharacterized protein n=1 Tax=Trypanosoma brucei equiperdum TaxID=630700 RepID=A0A3L6L2Q2_9TRYP|nr:hypothetical protein DPX39_080022200 [Trypanosoma brucei equiperdum]